MDEQTRRDVDEACCALLGRDPAHDSPSQDHCLVAPLAEALHDRGFLVRMFQTTTEGKRWSVSIVGKDGFGFLVAEESGDSLPVCLALTAARAMGTETKDA